jgi:hypothetical protein
MQVWSGLVRSVCDTGLPPCMLATTHTPVLARMHWEWVYYCYCCYRPLITKKWPNFRKFGTRPLQAPVAPSYVFVCETQTHMT